MKGGGEPAGDWWAVVGCVPCKAPVRTAPELLSLCFVLWPCYIPAPPAGRPVCALYVLERIFSLITYRPLLHNLLLVLFADFDADRPPPPAPATNLLIDADEPPPSPPPTRAPAHGARACLAPGLSLHPAVTKLPASFTPYSFTVPSAASSAAVAAAAPAGGEWTCCRQALLSLLRGQVGCVVLACADQGQHA